MPADNKHVPHPLPKLAHPHELTELERNDLKTITGRDYTAVLPGDPGDGIVGLVGTNGVDILKRELTPQTETSLVDRFLKFIGLADTGANSEAALLTGANSFGQLTQKRLHMAPSLARLFAEHDVRLNEGIEVIPRNEPILSQVKRLDSFNRFAASLTPELRARIVSVDFRFISPMVYGYAQDEIGNLRLGCDNLCEETPYHEIAHLLTSHLEGTDPTFRSEWDAIAGHVYIDTCSIDDQYESKAKLHAAGLISGYASLDYHEDISELCCAIYTKPDCVKVAMEYSPIFRQKIDFLHRRGYIRNDQFLYLTADGPLPAVREQNCA